MGSPPPDRPFPVTYLCFRCGQGFIVWQGEGGQDEDIDTCWDCIEELLPPRKTM